MKTKILCAIAVAGLVVGCAETRQHMGASAENDHNVLTGGPVTGTTLRDLPTAVRDSLHQQAASAEVADIDKQTRGGRVVYRISFMEPGKNPVLFIAEDGTLSNDTAK